ncbi:adenosine deaminase [Holotrichia oblita]|uniref:Adenosine deaminase n=1 Tax=Holotrichia oblita TaxID=644536 RepID=A0ACB9SKW4_HOLOL|nr:adenosine deaminase [Holotrichia oblita]
MRTLGYYIGISKQTEVLFLVLAGICCTIFDASLFNLHTNLYKVWNMPMDPTKFTDTAQLYVKYILSSIVLVRTFTVHLYLAFYIVMLWPAIFVSSPKLILTNLQITASLKLVKNNYASFKEEKSGLLIPWLVVGAIKCLAMGAMSFSTGLYICLTYRFSRAACWDFLMTQIIDQGPSIYMWFCVLSYYYDIRIKMSQNTYRFDRQTPSTMFSLAERRRRVRSLFADTKLQNTVDDDSQLISVSRIDNIINQLSINLRRDVSRSLDSLLTRLAAEAEKDEIFDIKDDMLDEDKDLSFAEKTLKVLNISPSYVNDVKVKRDTVKLITTPKSQQLKVQSSPLLPQKSRVDSFKTKKLTVKVPPMKTDELSLIISEAELNTIGFNDNKDMEKPLQELHREENFGSTDTTSDVQKIFEKLSEIQVLKASNSKIIHKDSEVNNVNVLEVNDLKVNDLEVKELHINSFHDNASETSKMEYIAMENNNFLRIKNTVNITKESENALRMNSETKKNTNTAPSSLKDSFKLSRVKLNVVNNVSNNKTLEPKFKANQPVSPTIKARVVNPIPKTLKSKSMSTNGYSLPTTSFKHDGYTLAYIENQQRKAARDIIRSRGRPGSSGI